MVNVMTKVCWHNDKNHILSQLLTLALNLNSVLMKSNIKTTETFYHNLGKLFYAIAFADKHVHEDETAILQQYVHDYWLGYDDLNDLFNSDAAHLIEIVFDVLQEFNEPSETMYEAFITYKNEQPQFFTDEVNQLILATARAIAQSYAGVNKSELVLLTKLEIELNRL